MQAVSYAEASENLEAMIEETRYLLRSSKNAERLLDAVRGFEADGQGVPLS
ncbi:hypothetical protein [Sphingomonas sp. 1185]|uniref:hypothetical protein n=1 Tax=Sphingomonas sp. 1185 TaxID=3156411 RepID=UPI003393E60C